MVRADYNLKFKEKNNDVDEIINFVKKYADAIADDYNSACASIAFHKANQICKDAVSLWYSHYTPRSYKRHGNPSNFTGGLFNAYDVGVENGDTFTFETGPDLMGGYYHQRVSYVYDITFVQGYHGGSRGKEKDGKPGRGEPWYRTPPDFDSWLKKAEEDFSILEFITDGWDSYCDNEFPEIRREILDKVIDKYLNKK